MAFKRSTHPYRADHAGLLDLAPGGVYLAAHVSVNTGGLLHHPFTIASSGIAQRSCLLSAVLSVPCIYRDPPFQRRLILRSSDFPPLPFGRATILPTSIIYSTAPSQNNIILQLEQVIISIFFLISIIVCGGSWL